MRPGEENWLESVPVDPWGNPYILERNERDGGVRVISCGEDGQRGTEDDIVHAAGNDR